MRKSLIIIACIIFIMGCSKNNDNNDSRILPVDTTLTNQNGLENWKLVMIPKINALGQQGYDIEFMYTGSASVKSVVVYYRVDTEEKLSGKTVKADSKTVVSKLDSNEKITLSDLVLPLNIPVSVEVDWLEGNHINKGTGTFKITETKQK
ncbi:hypothetical protein QFZ77_006943 [Paenibacillus sp. V4I3]|uniref:hypothetical protein n=1 Tax=Paenibacillus sp. V4I3 TaxID=3042305 RepID=UPI00277FCE90|nr:hypothetical protein [Paenibacillus sp. V4I3]MDQ0878284.1 hypothetical protein [Paenibacillus sp. V4I3]